MALTVLNPHVVASQGGYSRDRAAQVYKRMNSSAAMCVNDWEMAQYILALGGTPILRIRCPDDDDADARFDPIEYVNTAHTQLSAAEEGIPGAALKGRIHIGNELGSATPERTARWLEAAIRQTTFHKRKAVAANWSVKNPEPFMHPELARCGVYTAINVNGGEMGSHEGAYIDPKTGAVYRTFNECLASGAIGGYREAARKYGFRVRITEFAASKTPNDGWSTWMSEDEFAALCDDAGRFYAANGVQAHIYTAFKWDRGRGFEYVDHPQLQNQFANTNERYPVNQQPVFIPTPTQGGVLSELTKLPGKYVNVRSQPGGVDVGDLYKGNTINLFVSNDPGATGWVYVVPVNAPSALAGWVSLQGGAVEFTPVAPPQPSGVWMPEATLEALHDYFKRAEADMAAGRKLLEEVMPSLAEGRF